MRSVCRRKGRRKERRQKNGRGGTLLVLSRLLSQPANPPLQTDGGYGSQMLKGCLLCLGLLLFHGVAVSAGDIAPMDSAKQLAAAIRAHDQSILVKMLVHARIRMEPTKRSWRLRTEGAVRTWLEAHEMETKEPISCSKGCCRFDESDPWSDVPSHPRKACFAAGKLISLALVAGSQ